VLLTTAIWGWEECHGGHRVCPPSHRLDTWVV
jgi:hypothetical protein